MYLQTVWETRATRTKEYYKRYLVACCMDSDGKLRKMSKTRGKRHKASRKAVTEYNQRLRTKKLTRKINENFTQDDLYITLTYAGRKPSPEKAEILVSRFMDCLRRKFKKLDKEFKWVLRTEIGARNNVLHHHLLIPRLSDDPKADREYIRELWHRYAPGGIVKIIPLYSEEFSRLAAYFCKRSKVNEEHGVKQNYRCSRNLREPKETHTRVKASSWRDEPVVPRGWMLDKDSLEVGVNPLTGTGYQFYRLIKLEGTDKRDKNKTYDSKRANGGAGKAQPRRKNLV